MDVSELLEGFPRGVNSEGVSATAKFANPADIIKAHPYQKGRLFHGFIDLTAIGYNDDRHILTIAGSRAGKGTSAIIPNLILGYEGSVIAIDPKGELARKTARARGKGKKDIGLVGLQQEVFVLDPFNASGLNSQSAFNPLDLISDDHDNPFIVDDAILVADSLVVAQSDSHNAHWDETARELIKGLIIYVLKCYPEGSPERNLFKIRQIITDKDELDVILISMKGYAKAAEVAGQSAEPLVADSEDPPSMIIQEDPSGSYFAMGAAASSYLDKPDTEKGSVLSAARRHTEFLDSRPIQKVTGSTTPDLNIKFFKEKPHTLYLCLPAGRMATHSRWLRLVISLALETMERTDTSQDLVHPVLFLMDEFPVLGHMRNIEVAAGQIAGFGVKMWIIAQDIGQLQKHYKGSWETFVANAGILQFFANTDPSTLKFISEKLGDTSFVKKTQGDLTIEQKHKGDLALRTDIERHPLLTPEEVGRLFSRHSNRQLIIPAGDNPIVTERVDCFKGNTTYKGLKDIRAEVHFRGKYLD